MVSQNDCPDQQNAALALHLAQTLATRLCHDLAGGIGALGNALELASAERGPHAEAIALAKETAEQLKSRLRLLRAAFGPADGVLSISELEALIADIPRARRVRVQIEVAANLADLPARDANLLLCLAMLGIEGLAGDGVLVLERQSARDFVLQITGPRAAWPKGFAAALLSANHALTTAAEHGPRSILAPLVALMATLAGTSCRMLHGASSENAPPLQISFSETARL